MKTATSSIANGLTWSSTETMSTSCVPESFSAYWVPSYLSGGLHGHAQFGRLYGGVLGSDGGYLEYGAFSPVSARETQQISSQSRPYRRQETPRILLVSYSRFMRTNDGGWVWTGPLHYFRGSDRPGALRHKNPSRRRVRSRSPLLHRPLRVTGMEAL